MNKTTYVKYSIVAILLLLGVQVFAQNLVPFSPRYDQAIKGDMLLIGNSNVGIHVTDPYDGTDSNDRLDAAVYVDVDSDPTTFNSSTADLDVPDISGGCYQVVHASLYWSAVVNGTEPISDVKFRTPGSTSYVDITGTQVYYQNATSNSNSNVYVYHHDVTDIITALPNAEGTYGVANISSLVGPKPNAEGLSAGWSLFVIYEDPTLTSKYITSFDGFTRITSTINETFPITGFQTIPTGPVRAKFAFSTIEGDQRWTGDYLQINGTTIDATNNAGTVIRPSNNFFNSTVSVIDPINNTPELFFDRNPAGTNTLGFDAGIINIPNAGNTIIGNGDTSASIRLGSNIDIYYYYFSAFSIEIIAPNIVLTKLVFDEGDNDAEGQTVDLGDQLTYVIGFENTGNDHATNFTIRDILPVNTVFDYPTDLELLPPGVTVQNYNPATREIIFAIDNSVVEEGDPRLDIRFNVRVVETCSLLDDACSNIVDNQAYATYQGTINSTFVISDDPSFNTNTGCLITPRATNFLADLDCEFREEVVLCGDTVELTAGAGYDSYSWSTSPSGTPVIGTGQSITVNAVGTYYVHNEAIAPCQDIDQIFDVITYGAGVPNPVIPFADQVVICPNDGVELPNFFLCGGTDSRDIRTGITDASSIIWEVLDEGSCTAVTNQDCANTDDACTWNQVHTGENYIADTEGQYRLTINYQGGCFNQYYFNVYRNILTPTAVPSDIFCTTPGGIVVNGVPSGYEYSIDGTNYQTSNTFSITTPGIYTAYVRQIGVSPNPCIFVVPDLIVRERNFNVSTRVLQPLCHDDFGRIIVAANDVRPQYFFSIYEGATLINSVGPIANNNYLFNNLDAGTYTINVSTEDGCVFSGDVDIVAPPLLEATVALTDPLTCENGELTVYPQGGTPPYFYFVNSTTVFQSTPIIDVTAAGTYNITVVDNNNCSTDITIDVDAIAPPVFSVSDTDILCYNDDNGEIVFNVTNANGNTLEYSIDNGVTFVTNSTFSNLSAGTYQTQIRYTVGDDECLTTVEDVEITQPDAAVTASAGVSELAGCGPAGEGRLRITNPQGGVPPYEYSFDNQATWVTTNEAYFTPGSYTLYIRDANGCIYPMPDIVLDPEPVPPSLNIDTPDYNCDGTANSTVIVNNPGGASYEYTYLLDGVENPNTADPTTFLNVPDGSHTITVQYRLLDVPTFSNLLIEDFGFGSQSTTSPGIDFYTFESQQRPGSGRRNTSINDGEYSVTHNIVAPFAAWLNPVDHTTADRNTNGRYLVVNVGDPTTTAGISLDDNFYSQRINDIIPNQPIRVDVFLMNLIRSSRSLIVPDLMLGLVDPNTGTVVSSITTGDVPNNEQWNEYNLTLDPGTFTSLDFVVRTNIFGISGNDVAIDDISVFQLPTSCVTEVNLPFVIDSGNAFTAQIVSATDVTCSGADDGSITLDVRNFDTTNGYEYSLDGTNWNTETTSPFTITGLSDGNYTVEVRYDNTNTCNFSLNQVINTPNAVDVTATATDITCLANATVTAVGTGGTIPYTYELLDAATSTLVTNFPASGILTNVLPGNYLVRITDANNCQSVTVNTLNISAPTDPTATIDVTSDYCYDPVNGATLVVSASGGLAPYEYNINGGAFTTNNTFSSLTPGTYTIIVRDVNGCNFTIATQTIAPQIQLNALLTKGLDCSATPDGIITLTTTGGTSAFTYEVNFNGSGYTTIIGTPSPYTVTAAGTYEFRVTDSQGCIADSSVITVNPITDPTATVTPVNPTCNGDTNGSIQIIPSGGSGTYEFSFNGSAFTTTSFYDNLAAGTYNYEVRDDNECIFSSSVTLTAPNTLQATASVTPFICNVNNVTQSATVTINAPTGGTSPYQYSFNGSGYSATNTLTVSDTGSNQTINWSVRDAQGCIVNGSETLQALNPPTDLNITATTVTCLATTSDVTLTATNGVGTLAYTIEAPASATTNVTGATSGIFTGLLPDTYIFRVTDANGCYYDESFTVTPVTPIAVTGIVISDVLCSGGNTGAIEFTVSGNTGAYTYTLTGTGTDVQSGNTIDYTNLVAGAYTINVTDPTTGCTDSFTATINEPANPLTFTETSTNVFCTNDVSQITVTVNGGTPNYTYAAVVSGAGAPASGAYSSSNVITVDTNSATDLVWDVYVRDVNGCQTMNTVTITSDGLPTLDPIAQQCYDGSNITVTLSGTVSVGTAEYSMGSGYQASPTFTITGPGTYTFSIRDGNNCTVTQTLVVEPQIQLSALLTKGLDCTASPDGVITLTTSGGDGSYTYEVDTGSGFTTITGAPSPYTAATAGTYVFRVTDSQGCTADSTVVVNPITNPTVSESHTDPTCNGDTNGTITLTASGGDAPYEYSIDGGATYVNTNVFGGLGAGSYEYIVRDSNQCTSATGVTVVLNDPDPIGGNVLMNPIECNVNTPGSFDVSVTSGGVAPYTYILYDSSFTVLATHTETGSAPTTPHNFGGLTFGDYHITILDANNCEYRISDRIETPPFLDINGFVDSNNCATGVDYTVDTSGGIGPYIYSIFGQPASASPPIASTSYTFGGLLHGVTYFLQVEDANGCISIHEAVMPPPPSGIEITGTTTTDVNCFGDNNGTLNFTVENYDVTVTDINYQILDALTLLPVAPAINGTLTGPAGGPVSNSITTLPAGNYVLQATEATGTLCSNTYTFTIGQPIQALNASAVATPANCNAGAQVNITATGGTGPYTYEAGAVGFTAGAGDVAPTTNNVLVLDDAIRLNWEILVTDANGCEFRFTESITRDANPTISPVVDQCYIGSDLTVTLSGTTFNGSATYSMDGITFQASPTFTISAPGTYTFTIQDDNGCTASTVYTVQPQLQLLAALTKDLDCTVTPDAIITLTPSGGTSTYTGYEVNYNGGGFVAIPGTPYTATAAGTYEFRVTDSQPCTAISNTITIDPLVNPTANETHIDVSCNGENNGSITVTASGGVGPYEYSNDNGSSFQTSNVFSGLIATTYNIVVRDSKSCVSTAAPVTIDEPTSVGGSPTLTQSLSCGTGNATQSAIITVTGSGGTPPYMYSYDGGTNYTTDNTYTTNLAGSVTIFVRDANGCVSPAIIETVPALDPPTDLDFSSAPITCLATTTDVTLTATDGVGPLAYAILSPASATTNVTGATTGIFTGLTPDTYMFEVTDANGCTYQESYTISPVTNITVSEQLINNVTCNGAGDGAVTFTVGDFAGTYSYTINGGVAVTGQTSSTIPRTGLTPATYTIIVTDDTTGCTATTDVTVSEPPSVSLLETTNINANCNLGAQVTVTASGGTAPFTYAFVQDGVAPTPGDYTTSDSRVLDPTVNTAWDVYVLDVNGCSDMIDVTVTTDPLPSATIPPFASNQCNLTGPYTFTVASPTGIAPFDYSIDGGMSYQTSPTFAVNTPGTYTVTMRDGNGCTIDIPATIDIYTGLDLTPAITTLPSCSDDDGVVTVTGSGGSGTYTYSISPNPASITLTGNVFSGVPSGTYTITITDPVTTCTDSEVVVLDAATPVTFTTTPEDVSCNGASDGMITVNLPVTNDNPIYSYEITAGPLTRASQSSNIFADLPAGTYTILVTSGRGCSLSQDETVGEPNPITVPAPTVVEYACTAGTNTSNLATITVTGVTGGSGTYTNYEFIRGGSRVQFSTSNVYSEADLLGGAYTINVFDENGCVGTTTATIQPFISIDNIDITVDTPITCTNDEDITVTVTSTGGTPTNLEYTVEDTDGTNVGLNYNQTNSTGVFTALPIGNYLITVTNLDTSCSIQTVHTILDPNTFDLMIDSVVNVTCFNDTNGSANITFIDRAPTPTDESGAFNYTVTDMSGATITSGTTTNAGPITVGSLVSGTYTVTASLVNIPFCTVIRNFTIEAPTEELQILETHTEITCVTGNNDGTILASATGGWPGPYGYQLELGATIVSAYSDVFNFSGLTAGTYTVRVRDSQNCIASTTVTLVNPVPITADIVATPTTLACFGDDNASITVSNVVGGQGSNYSYTLNTVLPIVSASGPQTSPVFNNLAAGTYNVTVTDGFNCSFTTTNVVIVEPTEVDATLVQAMSQTCTVDASLTLSATGGTGPYDYSDTANFTTITGSFATSTTFTVMPGTYRYYVRDANGCIATVTNDVAIDPLEVLTLDMDTTNSAVNCEGDLTGTIIADAQGGVGSYVYELQDTLGNAIPATQNSPGVFTELGIGSYRVYVVSGADCFYTSADVTIAAPSPALQVTPNVTNVSCFGENSGVIEINVVPGTGTGTIKYAISPQLNQFFEEPIFTDLFAGDYQVVVQDELGCFEILDITITEPLPVSMTVVPGSMIPEVCQGDMDGEFSIEISGGTMPYSVAIDDINGPYTTGGATQTEFPFDNLSGGNHLVYIRDAQGCETEWTVNMPESVLLDPEVQVDYCTDVADATSNTVTVTIDDSVDPADVDYSLDGTNFQASNVFVDVTPGTNLTITVRHTNTCERMVTFDVNQYDPLQIALNDSQTINTIEAQATGGSGNYEYAVRRVNEIDFEPYQDTGTFIIYESGIYEVSVTDSNGCVASAERYFEYIDVCIPNYYTPANGSGGWGPGCTSQYRDLTVDLFDRYGRVIATLRVDEKWNGDYNGKPLPSGDYWYVLKLNDPRDNREFVGHFTLYR